MATHAREGAYRLFVNTLLALAVASPTALRAEYTVTLHAECPEGFVGPAVEVSCSLIQGGRVIAEWSWEATRAATPQEYTFTRVVADAELARAPDPRGTVELFVCLNQDDLRSCHPSIGDFFHRRSVSLAEGAVSLRVAGEWKRHALSRPENLLTVHYHRSDGDYRAVGLWTWGESPCRTPPDQERFAVGRNPFGPVFQLDLGDYACAAGRIGLLPRLNGSWDQKDSPDRFWESSLGPEVYLLRGDAKIYSRMPDISPKLAAASLASEEEIILRFSDALPVDDLLPRIALFDEGGRDIKLATIEPREATDGRARAFAVRPASALEIAGHTYRIRAREYGEAPVSLGAILSDLSRFGDPDAVMGASCTPEATRFRVFAPTARQVTLVIAAHPTGAEGLIEHALEREPKGLWSRELKGDHRGKFYSFRVATQSGASGEVADPYAVCATGAGPRAMLVDLRDTNPKWFDPTHHRPLAAPTDAIIYEMSVRDFTICARSGVKNKGLFLGLTEPDTHVEGDPSVKTGLDHLSELGITHVQLMPIQDFENDERSRTEYNWGYMPVLFNTPDGWFATEPVGDARIRELKAAVQALHDRGVGVTLDVVYNHTSSASPLDKLVPGYYYRMTETGQFSNGSGCGNELNSESPMGRKLMLDSLLYWVREFGIDGFRFDLMGLHAPETMMAVRDALRAAHPEVLIYGEPWAGGATTLPEIFDKSRSRGTGIAAFNDHFRDAIKGDRDGGAAGFVQVGDRADGVKKGVPGAIDDWAAEPGDTIQYCEAHDNLTLWDKLAQSAPEASPELRERMQRFAGFIVLTSQGIPFLHSGQEFCRSKRGNSNSYNAPDEVNRIDWSLKKSHAAVFAYYRGLIALRKAHPVFRLRTAEEVRRRMDYREPVPHPKCIAYTLKGKGVEGESFSTVLVLMNGDLGEQTFALPEGTWAVYADADRAETKPLRTVRDQVTLVPHSGMMLAK